MCFEITKYEFKVTLNFNLWAKIHPVVTPQIYVIAILTSSWLFISTLCKKLFQKIVQCMSKNYELTLQSDRATNLSQSFPTCHKMNQENKPIVKRNMFLCYFVITFVKILLYKEVVQKYKVVIVIWQNVFVYIT